MSIDINEDLIPEAIATMDALMDSSDEDIRYKASSKVLDGTIFKKNIINNNLFLNPPPKEIQDGFAKMKELADENVSVRKLEEDNEG